MGDEQTTERMFPIMGAPNIPWRVIAPHEQQAIKNHDQTLKRLAERGGLAPCEAIWVMEGRRWQHTIDDQVDGPARLAAMVDTLIAEMDNE